MAGKTIEERLLETEQRIKQLQAQKANLERQVKEKARKERTRRLIQIGGIWAHLGIATVEEHQELQRYFEAHPRMLQRLRAIATKQNLDEILAAETKEPAAP